MSYKNNDSNKGKKWSNEEISDLTNEFMKKTPIAEIALSHKRSERAIELQGLLLASKMLKDKSLDKVQQIYGFTGEDFEKFNEFKEKQQENKLKQLVLGTVQSFFFFCASNIFIYTLLGLHINNEILSFFSFFFSSFFLCFFFFRLFFSSCYC